MEQTFARILLLLSLSAAFAKYVYIKERKTWPEAQEYCRRFHTDLAPISNTHDNWRFRGIAGDSDEFIWIGLRRNCTDNNAWTWSGGGGVSKFFWANNQPDNRLTEDYGAVQDCMWHDVTPEQENTFFCYRAVVVRERKTWEEALEYCREHHRDLASVASDTEMMLIQKELNKNETAAARFWIGLRFFPGGWLWVDRQPLRYEAWGPEGTPECPDVKRKCGALRVTGAAVGRVTRDAQETKICEVNTAAQNHEVGDVEVKEWEARDCVERLPFICY